MNKLKTLIIAVAALVGLASCNNSGSGDYETEQNIGGCFAEAVNTATGESVTSKSVGYYLRLNYTSGLATVEVSGLELPGGLKYPTLRFSDLSFSVEDNGWKKIKGTMVTPTSTGFGSLPTFSTLEIQLLDRITGQSYVPVIILRANVNGVISVLSAAKLQLFAGETVSVSPSGDRYKSTETMYVVSVDFEKMTAGIQLTGARFVEAMPSMDITFKDVPFTYSSGRILLKRDALIPEMGNTPQPSYPISNLVADFDISKGMELGFDCSVHGATYHVDAHLEYNPKTDEKK